LGPYSAFVPVVEGTRLNTDLYAAHPSQHIPPTDVGDRVLPPLVDASPPTRSTSVWPLPSPSGLLHSTLTRQPSIIRRPGRSRAPGFSEFTAARRNSIRQLAQDDEPPSRSEFTTATSEMPSSSSLRSTTDDHPRTSSVQARRSFPFGRRRFEVIPTPRPAASTSEDWFFPPSGWTTTPPERLGAVQGDVESNDERLQAPRLRRGGLRASESLLSPPLTPNELLHTSTTATTATTERGSESLSQANPSTDMSTRSISEELVQSIGGP
jgi:hypothetical protein